MNLILKELCGLAMTIANATQVRISRMDSEKKALQIFTGTSDTWKTFDPKFAFPALASRRPVWMVRDIRLLPQMDKHPILELMPNLSRFAVYHLIDEEDGDVFLFILNPSEQFFFDDRALVALERLVEVFKRIMTASDHWADPDRAGYKNTAPLQIEFHDAPPDVSAPVTQFLFDTLVDKPRLLGRNGVSYLSLRTWRKAIKAHQLAALVAMKSAPSGNAVDKIAGEIVTAVNKTFGNNFQTVVPVPAGSSGRPDSLSVQLVQSVASRLGIQFGDVLINVDGPGSSHPKKSSKVPPFGIKSQVKGNVLVVDDVATSGRHIELATMALRPSCDFCTSVVWIAD